MTRSWVAIVSVVASTFPVSALDQARAATLRRLGRLGRPLLARRELRVAVIGTVGAAVALALTVLLPLQLLMVGPLLFGVPHLVADVRYLVAKPGIHRRSSFWVLCAPLALGGWVWPHASLGGLAIAGAAMAATLTDLREGVSRAPHTRPSFEKRAAVYVVAVALTIACFTHQAVADIVMAHAHNLFAVVLFCGWRRNRRSAWAASFAPIALFVIGSILLLGGTFDRTAFAALGRGFVDPTPMLATLAPVSDPVWATRLLLFFAFAQSMHYGVWLRLIPEQDRDRPGVRSFASSLRALAADVGRPLFVAGLLLTVGLVLWSLRSIESARIGYLRLAMFHGPLELGAATLLWLEGYLPRRSAE